MVFINILFRKMADPRVTQWFMAQDQDRTGRLDATQLQQALRNNNHSTFDIAVVQVALDSPCRHSKII